MKTAALGQGPDPGIDRTYHGDAFRLCAAGPKDSGATVLYLNPPYDHDPEHGRANRALQQAQAAWDFAYRNGWVTANPWSARIVNRYEETPEITS